MICYVSSQRVTLGKRSANGGNRQVTSTLPSTALERETITAALTSGFRNMSDNRTAHPPHLLVAEGLHRRYRQGPHEVHAVRGTDLAIGQGEFVSLMGPSGSGKSSLLYLLGGLDRPDEGRVTVEGNELGSLDEAALALFRRRRVGFVLQFFNLMPTLTALENVALPLELDGRPDASDRAAAMLERVGLRDRGGHRPGQLSGGEQQRVALARSLVTSPALVLADEPTGSLDTTTGTEILELIREVVDGGQTVVMATHAEESAKFTTRVVRISDGRVVEDVGGG
jgi:putative ABC transport system ATP-binding protein